MTHFEYIAVIVSIILGLGMPTPSAYILAAVLVGPLLIDDLGVNLLAGHMFLLYFAVLSAMTPPVAVAAYAASAIAGIRSKGTPTSRSRAGSPQRDSRSAQAAARSSVPPASPSSR